MSKNPLSATGSQPERVGTAACVVELRGELDLLSAPLATARLDPLTSGPCPDIVLDMRKVTFIDCTGLGVLCRARSRARARYGRLRLVTDDPGLLRILRHTGLGGVFDVHPRLPDALVPPKGRGRRPVSVDLIGATTV
ncbi:STAS domain-containing protein [Streptomyces sp. NPDC126514]|uniref:STAS domain-containing protein n=1 Tax=Streptomyces sp. NPDC126514 TaxID=3155210 RepID=UPI0033214654